MIGSNLGRLRRIAGLDGPVFTGLAARGWSFAAGPITSLLIVAYFSGELQGYHFAFLNLAVVVQLSDLGLSTVVQQFVAHERAEAPGATGSGWHEVGRSPRVAALARFVAAWSLAGGLVLFCGMFAAGTLLFGGSQGSGNVNWQGPWAMMCAVAAFDLGLQLSLAFLEGSGRMAGANVVRLTRAVASSLTLWLGILAGFGLWAVPASAAAGVFASFVLLAFRHKWMFQLLRAPRLASRISWRGDIAPFQARLAISALSGFLMYSLFVPVVFHFRGPVEAGRFGMTWGLVEVVLVAATTWVAAVAPRIGTHIAGSEHQQAERLAVAAGVRGLAAALLGGVALLTGLLVMGEVAPGISVRFLPVGTAALLVVAGLFKTVIGVQTVYLRAHRREPLFWIFLSAAVLVSTGGVLGAWSAGTLGAAAAYAAVMVFYVFPLATRRTLQFRQRRVVLRPADTDLPPGRMVPAA